MNLGDVVKELSICFLLAAIIISGCATTINYTIHYDVPLELKDSTLYSKFINSYQPHITGKKIFIDPGHGGSDRKGIGPKGLAIEADVNLRVALELRKFLEDAGVDVVMSRAKDKSVPLKERSLMANASGADLFISIHHNSTGNPTDDFTNYTSTFYHAKETDYEHEPCERDVARFIQRDLAYVMRTPGGLGSFDGTYSDYIIYPKAGFSVLRLTDIPAVLVEGSFFSNKIEEQKLIIDEFNKIQAWGIFRGIARYYRTGYPSISFQKAEILSDSINTLVYKLTDESEINPKSIRVFIDSVETENFNYDKKNSELRVDILSNINPETIIRIIAANNFGNHALPFHDKRIIKSTK